MLPEAFLTGYCRSAFAGPVPLESELPTLLAPLRAVASDHGITVVVGTPLDRAGRRTLATVVVGADGSVAAPYDKQHLSGYERDHFDAGGHGSSLVVDGWELGLAICYDASFPEHARAAAADGALGYLVSAAFFPGGAERRDLYAAARALDNGVYVVLSGLAGPCGDEEFIGGSAIFDPEGRVLARVAGERGIVVADLDTAVVRDVRARHPMLRDRRVDLGPRSVTGQA
ncbi:carbon-nitrogen hydrolase family protein [Nocardioides alcanivorans]|uniref:carbon-nitrogen hydrolase family protein n=1 Tax=Nocardioides alcanivorans TaxID=2897352 RepID=UPI001F469781|nr:carbon-nitrogen hydrolase family protein [Nocardioides alcanivorans]